jgi:hypothetical protein
MPPTQPLKVMGVAYSGPSGPEKTGSALDTGNDSGTAADRCCTPQKIELGLTHRTLSFVTFSNLTGGYTGFLATFYAHLLWGSTTEIFRKDLASA